MPSESRVSSWHAWARARSRRSRKNSSQCCLKWCSECSNCTVSAGWCSRAGVEVCRQAAHSTGTLYIWTCWWGLATRSESMGRCTWPSAWHHSIHLLRLTRSTYCQSACSKTNSDCAASCWRPDFSTKERNVSASNRFLRSLARGGLETQWAWRGHREGNSHASTRWPDIGAG